VEGEDRNAAAGIQTRVELTQQGVEGGELVVHGNAERLEDAAEGQ
jgi:hypothetical protein